MYEASEAIEAAAPVSATMRVIQRGEVFAIAERMIVGMRPERSATATPNSTTSTRPRAGKVT